MLLGFAEGLARDSDVKPIGAGVGVEGCLKGI